MWVVDLESEAMSENEAAVLSEPKLQSAIGVLDFFTSPGASGSLISRKLLEFQTHCKLKNARVESSVNRHEGGPKRIDRVIEIHPVESVERLGSELNSKSLQRTKRLL